MQVYTVTPVPCMNEIFGGPFLEVLILLGEFFVAIPQHANNNIRQYDRHKILSKHPSIGFMSVNIRDSCLRRYNMEEE